VQSKLSLLMFNSIRTWTYRLNSTFKRKANKSFLSDCGCLWELIEPLLPLPSAIMSCEILRDDQNDQVNGHLQRFIAKNSTPIIPRPKVCHSSCKDKERGNLRLFHERKKKIEVCKALSGKF
jgi:hypothetical protein